MHNLEAVKDGTVNKKHTPHITWKLLKERNVNKKNTWKLLRTELNKKNTWKLLRIELHITVHGFEVNQALLQYKTEF